MYDLLIVCKEPYSNSLFGCIGTAVVSTKQENSKVALMLTQEAVIALSEKKFVLAPLLKNYADNLSAIYEQFEFPEDPAEMITMAVNAGVKVFTCEIWASLTSSGSLPSALDIIPVTELIKIIAESKKILGSF